MTRSTLLARTAAVTTVASFAVTAGAPASTATAGEPLGPGRVHDIWIVDYKVFASSHALGGFPLK